MNNNKGFEYISKICYFDINKIYDTELVEIFCEYISSNPYFKYNKTYLKDSIIPFQKKIKEFFQKKEKIFLFQKELSSYYKSLENWYIVIDNMYLIKPDCQVYPLENFEKYNYFNNLIKQFNLFQYDTESVFIRYVKLIVKENIDIKIENEYCEIQNIKVNNSYKKIELNTMVKKSLSQNNMKVGKKNE